MPALGCVADDITGATDLASALVREGLRTLLLIGEPADSDSRSEEADAIVVALKTRSVEPSLAIAQSVASLRWLRHRGAVRFLFKYCSTFDSTEQGNLGPVIDALMTELGTEFTVACPAFPANGRTVYQGHLFVGSRLLSESGMEKHPLNPMTDANLVRVLQRQTTRSVGLLPYQAVKQGAAAIRTHIDSLRATGCAIAIADALSEDDLRSLGEGCYDLPLVTGASGMAICVCAGLRKQGLISDAVRSAACIGLAGSAAILAGSCSDVTLRQIEHFRKQYPAHRLDVTDLIEGRDAVKTALDWARPRLGSMPLLIYSSTDRNGRVRVADDQSRNVPALIEATMGQIAVRLVSAGVRGLIVAGGETSGAVLAALKTRMLRVGPEVSPGVPWTETLAAPRLALALKSGNFGDEAFFTRAWELLK